MPTRFRFLTMAAVMVLAGCSHGNGQHVEDMRVEGLQEPLAIDTSMPSFSWKLTSSARNDCQTAMQIQVASEASLLDSDKADIWDSGKVESDASVMVPYAGNKLDGRSLYWWRVRVWDKGGAPSPWSPAASFGVGALDGLEGEFIGMDETMDGFTCPLVRKKIRVNPEKRTVLNVNSLGYHEVWVNGNKAGDHVLEPAVSQFTKRSWIVSYDITPYLDAGATEADLVLWLGQGWYRKNQFSNAVHDGPLVKAEICELDGNLLVPINHTDATWKVCGSGYTGIGSWHSGDFGGERVEGRLVPKSMDTKELDSRDWKDAAVKTTDILSTPQMFPGDVITDTISPVKTIKSGAEGLVIDMGRCFTGWLSVKFKGLEPGQEVKIEYTDNMSPGEEFKPMPPRDKDIYIAEGKDGETFINKFNFHAFRYIRISSPEGGLSSVPEVTGLQISGDYPDESGFESSDPDLNAIHDMIKGTFRCLAFSGYMVDCATIERRGYGGDGNSSTMSFQTMFGGDALYRNWLQAWDDEIYPDGDLPYVAPAYRTGGGPYWGTFVALAPWRTYVNYGDKSLLAKLYGTMKHWIDYLDAHTSEGLLQSWPDSERHTWFLGDWLPPKGIDATDARSVGVVVNCAVSEYFHTLSKIASILGETDDAALFSSRRDKLNKLIHSTWYNQEDSTYASGVPIDMAYPLLVGAVPQDLRAAVSKKLTDISEDTYRSHIAVGLVGVPIFTQWATENRECDLMYSILKQKDYPGYLYMLESGGTATWESWEGRRSRIHNCYNGIGTWFYQALGGIVPDEDNPGYRHIAIAPQFPAGLDWVKVRKETPYGTVKVEWKRKGKKIEVQASVPTGVEASFNLPDNAVLKVR